MKLSEMLLAALACISAARGEDDDESCPVGKIRHYRDECNDGTGDLLFLLDASTEARGTFPKQLSAARKLAGLLHIGENQTRVGVASYSSNEQA
eukprot:gene20641-11364_t